MTTHIAASLATSIAARMAAVDTLALFAAVVGAVAVIGSLVGSMLLDLTAPRPYLLTMARRGGVPRLPSNRDVSQAA
jgi:hypothetical protein